MAPYCTPPGGNHGGRHLDLEFSYGCFGWRQPWLCQTVLVSFYDVISVYYYYVKKKEYNADHFRGVVYSVVPTTTVMHQTYWVLVLVLEVLHERIDIHSGAIEPQSRGLSRLSRGSLPRLLLWWARFWRDRKTVVVVVVVNGWPMVKKG
jgi:hypothetical protein